MGGGYRPNRLHFRPHISATPRDETDERRQHLGNEIGSRFPGTIQHSVEVWRSHGCNLTLNLDGCDSRLTLFGHSTKGARSNNERGKDVREHDGELANVVLIRLQRADGMHGGRHRQHISDTAQHGGKLTDGYDKAAK